MRYIRNCGVHLLSYSLVIDERGNKNAIKHNLSLRQLQVGQWVDLNPFNSSESLRPVVNDYNKLVSRYDIGLKVDIERIVDLRDSLAHGRLFSFEQSSIPMVLFRFGQCHVNKKTELKSVTIMTNAWLRTPVRNDGVTV